MLWLALAVALGLLFVVCYALLDAAAWDGLGFYGDDDDEEE